MKSCIIFSCLIAASIAAPAAKYDFGITASKGDAQNSSTTACYQKVMQDLDTRRTQDAIMYSAGQSCMANGTTAGIFVSCVTTTSLSNGASSQDLGDFVRDLLRCSPSSTSLVRKRQSSCVQADGAVVDLNEDDMLFADQAIASCASSNTDDDTLYDCIKDYVDTNDDMTPPRTNGIISVAFQCSVS